MYNVTGLDFAHATNGYVYHTSYDSLHAIPTGTIQHTGDNLLALTKHIASSDILNHTQDYAYGRCIYYDFVGLFFINYTELTGVILNVTVVLISLYATVKNILAVRTGL